MGMTYDKLERSLPKAKIRKSLNGKLHLSGGMNAAFCSSGNRGMNFEARVSVKNAGMFPVDCFCKKCFGKNPLKQIKAMVDYGSLD